MTGDDFLETLQADVLAILRATPSLTGVNIIAEDDGDMEAKIMRTLGSLTGGSTNKAGSVAVVMLPAITEAEANLPGPPLTVSVKVQVIEQSIINRAAAGSGVRSSEGALRVLNALHHHGLAYAALYAGANPVEPVDVKKGYLSHMVSLTLQFRGLSGPGKPAQVEAEMGVGGGDDAVITFGGNPTGDGMALEPIPFYKELSLWNGKPRWFDESFSQRVNWETEAPARWVFSYDGFEFWSLDDTSTPYDAECVFTPAPTTTGALGVPVFVASGDFPTITLTCATAGASIRYTTDGSYPSPSKTLYTVPIAGLAAGTTVRAAAYKTALNPGDVTELLITE
jgi:hypothetical protein